MTSNKSNTAKAPPPDARSDTAIEPPIAGATQLGLGVPHATSEPDLESRIRLRRAELIGKLRELRADTRIEATQAGDKLKAKLSEIGHLLKEGVVEGWTSLGDTVKQKLEHWLAESAGQLPLQNVPAKIGQS
jgi:hypothetical protein